MLFQFIPIAPELELGALIIALAIAIILHEVAHGWAALYLGDPTAKLAGRLSLNPLAHIDMWGTVIVPALLILSGTGFLFGWAKPVPVNYFNLRGGKYGPVIVALAGPLTNLVITIVFGLLARFAPVDTALPYLFFTISLLSSFLMFFNLIPIPPLDGSKILYLFLENKPEIRNFLEQYSFYILIGILLFAGGIISSLVVGPATGLVRLVTGF